MTETPCQCHPDEQRVTYAPRCQECGGLIATVKCARCIAVDTLPPWLVSFGEAVRPLTGQETGQP
jgi:hypothetical protein